MCSTSRRSGAAGLALVVAAALAAGAGAGELKPRKMVAVLDTYWNVDYGPRMKSVGFYDVTDLQGTVFGAEPMFSIWTGYEDIGVSWEEPGAITVNPANGTVYMLAYDSGTPGETTGTGDTSGDYDLYRIDYQEVLKDFVTNGRAAGTMYIPEVGCNGIDYKTNLITHPGEDYPPNWETVYIDGAIAKVGEVARNQGDSTYFDYDIDFVRPDRMVVLDDQTGADVGSPDAETDPTKDHRYMAVNRVSKDAGQAVYVADGTDQGGWNGQTSQSWQSADLGLVNLDFDANGDPFGRSEPEDIEYVARDGVEGVWVGESDTTGDAIAFYEIANWSGPTGNGYREMAVGPGNPYPTRFVLDDDPTQSSTTNDGSHDWVKVDESGNLLVGESGYFEDPRTEPKVIIRAVSSYNQPDSDASGANEIDFGAWGVMGPISPTPDDDDYVTDGRFVCYDKGTRQVYFLDADTGNFLHDVYVYNLDTGALEFAEQDALLAFFSSSSGKMQHGSELFCRGDLTGDGVVGAGDIDLLDGLIGGTPDELLKEWYDLTGDEDLTGDDREELIRGILGTQYGDGNLDGEVNYLDVGALASNYGQTSMGWADADYTGDGAVSYLDVGIVSTNYGWSAGGAAAGVPEPVTAALLGLGALALLVRRRGGVAK